ncbi:MAG: 23S rRNA (uracil(1939)-C(5))-methyltransferase RlmD [Marinilabiliaceae bacterium]|jgi:23S rRNA (uracil1939-C5)-methyltransferase|nr:23S rRNA (uracil(1939)-C(5))-methyltransferase RlmD [Marinilabiliaceae bacterium]
MPRSKKPLLEKVEITAIGSEGKALGRVDEKVVFVPMLVPGDVVDIQVTRKRKSFMEGFVTKFHRYSELRQEPECKHFGVCGGCKWQHLPYNEQLKFKQQQVEDNFSRLGKFEFPPVSEIKGSEKQFFYRNKLEFTFSNKRWMTKEEIGTKLDVKQRNALGFHVPGMFDKVLDIDTCYLQSDISNRIRNSVREYAIENNIEFHDIREHKGILRTLIIRNSAEGQLMVILNLYQEDLKVREGLLNHLKNTFPEISSLMYVINHKPHDSIGDLEVKLFSGQDHIIEVMEDLKFRVGPKSFYQTNSMQAYELYKVAREYAGCKGDEIVYDLYTGTGTIANFIARSASKVVGLEYVPEAIEDAKINSALNGIENTTFFAGDIKDLLNEEFIERNGHPDVIITDPPRPGMHEAVVKSILRIMPEKIVYVSCNPATQARDISLLAGEYDVVNIQPVDMFPQTHHVENVVLLRRKA